MTRIQFNKGFDSSMKYAIYGTYAEFGPAGTGPSRLRPHPIFMGHDVYKLLKENNVTIYPVSPDVAKVDQDQVFTDFKDLPKVDALIMATPGDDALAPLQKAYASGIRKVWFLRRALNKNLESYCKEKGIEYVNKCLLRHRKITGNKKLFAFCYWHGALSFAKKFPKHVGRV